MRLLPSLIGMCVFAASANLYAATYETPKNYIQTAQSQNKLTPQAAIKKLQEGNLRFLNGTMRNRDFALQSKTTTKAGQAPFAVILSCMDSRGPAEIIFDQGIGDIFSLRVAGNVLNTDNIASLEFATEVSGARVIVVMGHTHCGAMESACNNVKLGHITELLDKIKPAVSQLKKQNATCDSTLVNAIAKQNVLNNIKLLPHQSELVSKLVAEHKIMIVGAMHDLSTGQVNFFDDNGRDF